VGKTKGGVGMCALLGVICCFLFSHVFSYSPTYFFLSQNEVVGHVFVRNSLNQRVYFGGRVRDVPMRRGVQWERTVLYFWL
jgi:hypothetical protein